MRRNEYHHTGQQLKDDFEEYKKTAEYKKRFRELMFPIGVPEEVMMKIFTSGWWAGRVAQLNHRPIKQPA